MSKAAQLVLNIFLRVPILPRSLFLNANITNGLKTQAQLPYIQAACQTVLMGRILDQNYIHLEMDIPGHSLVIPIRESRVSEKWQQSLTLLDSVTVIELALEVVRALQYLHSMGIALRDEFDIRSVHLDLSLLPKIRIAADILTLINPFTRSTSERSLYEGTVFGFGWFLYQVRLHPALPFPITH
ncbi:hypothetical protein JOM56_002753 [Amanita muscaria]